MATAALEQSAQKQQLRRKLRAWYRRNARDLPWRRTHDPYAIWVSEIMLQQTTVTAVVPYFERFLKTFPNVNTLATASEQQVLKLWEGLGYYRRARQLHAAARLIESEYAGAFPETLPEILELPGVGRYTAGAIASFAFDQPAPIVEANTARLYARLLAIKTPLTESTVQKQLWEFAESIVPRRNPGELNQALMELGANVCKPRDPDCPDCPVMSFCEAHRRGWQAKIPVPPPKPGIEDVHETAAIIKAGQKWLLLQRSSEERWSGLWDFPRVTCSASTSNPEAWTNGTATIGLTKKAIAKSTKPSNATASSNGHAQRIDEATYLDEDASIREQLRLRFGITVRSLAELTTLRHAVTRFRITLRCVAGTARHKKVPPPARWATLTEIQDLPLTTPARKIAKKLA